jgi:WD40-like Beta Propeller Repeat
VPTSDFSLRAISWYVAVLVACLSALAAVGVAVSVWSRNTLPPRPVKQFLVQFATPFSGIGLSPDGSLLAYVVREAAVGKIHLRSFDRFEPRSLEGSEGASPSMPIFSPDGKWVAFSVGGTLKKLPITGGTPETVCAVPEYLGASWSDNGDIVIAQRKSGVMRVSANGGAPELITAVDVKQGELDHHSPSLLPGNKALLFTIHAGPDVFRVAVRSLATGEQRVVVDDGFDARYLPSGHLVYARGRTLYAAPFDISRLDVAGPAIPILERVLTEPYSGVAAVNMANDGTLVYIPPINLEHRSLVWVNRDGTTQPLPVAEGAYDRSRTCTVSSRTSASDNLEDRRRLGLEL